MALRHPTSGSGQNLSAASIDILLAEDNPADVRAFREALKVAGIRHELYVVIDGEEALRFLHRQPPYENAARPQLLVLDLKLPRVSGLAVLSAMKLDPQLKELPVIVLTSASASQESVQPDRIGANSVIRKPVGIKALAAELKIIPGLVRATLQRTAAPPEPVPDAIRIYVVAPCADGRWVVESPGGIESFFPDAHDAQDFALQLARKDVPSQVRLMSRAGTVIGAWNCDEPGP
jgi:two-component system, chemotaxis family, response regulator Rcp1